jgi:hypothetical protein
VDKNEGLWILATAESAGHVMPICLVTSIRPPSDEGSTAYLRDCLQSWRAAGFDTVAVNGPAETEALRRLDLGIEFAVTSGDGKPRIGALLSAIRERSCRFAGIINSDCKIIGYPNIAGNLRAGLERRIALAWRLDVADGAKPKADHYGFDAFFFDTSILPSDDAGFSIGESWWDQWFPLACEACGANIETFDVPLLIHQAHPQNWSWQQWENNGRRFWTTIGKPGSPSKTDLHALNADIQARLHAMPQTIPVIGPPEIEAVLRLGGRAMLVAAEAGHLRAELARMHNSTFWRLTAPLRAAVNLIPLSHRARKGRQDRN